jgi:hypothetical protein
LTSKQSVGWVLAGAEQVVLSWPTEELDPADATWLCEDVIEAAKWARVVIVQAA